MLHLNWFFSFCAALAEFTIRVPFFASSGLAVFGIIFAYFYLKESIKKNQNSEQQGAKETIPEGADEIPTMVRNERNKTFSSMNSVQKIHQTFLSELVHLLGFKIEKIGHSFGFRYIL